MGVSDGEELGTLERVGEPIGPARRALSGPDGWPPSVTGPSHRGNRQRGDRADIEASVIGPPG